MNAVQMLAFAIASLSTAGLGAQTIAPMTFTPLRGANVVAIVAHEYSFDLPDTLLAGLTTFAFRNAGKEIHHVKLAKIPADKSIVDVFDVLRRKQLFPDWMQMMGAPNAPLPTGGMNYGTVMLGPGRYVAFCGANAPDKQPHFMKGMLKSITVVPSKRRATLPEGDEVITLSNYTFTLSHPLLRGPHIISVHNAASQAHEVFIARFRPGKTAADYAAWRTNRVGPAPLVPFGGATDVRPGGTMVLQSDFPPGAYEFICFVTDAQDRKAHYDHGMSETVVVK